MNEPIPMYQERDILALPDLSIRWRVLIRTGNTTYWFEMDRLLQFPQRMDTPQIEAELNEGQLIKVELEEDGLSNFSEKAQAHAKTRFEAFKVIIDNPVLAWDAMFAPGRPSVFAKLKETYCNLTYRVFHKGLRQFWRGDGTAVSFVPNWSACGHAAIDVDKLEDEPLKPAIKHTQALAIAAAQREIEPLESLPDYNAKGFPRQRLAKTRQTAFRVDRKVLRVFLHYFRQKSEGKSLHKLRDQMIAEVLVRVHPDGSTETLPESAHPTERCFRGWYYVLIPHRDRRVATVGELQYQQQEREKLGNEFSSVERAGQTAAGDATIWNVAVISRFPGQRVVGPPVVFRIRCKKSGMLLGLSVSLENASWTGLGAAMVNCLEDKVEFCARYGVTITADEWPVRGLPGSCDLDRGESDNHHPDAFVDETGVKLNNLKGKRPDLKGGVESDWRTLEVSLNGWTPSACVKTWEQQQNQDWKLQATLTLDAFIARLLRHELNRMKQPREGLRLTSEMIAQGYTSSPLDVWNYSVKNEAGGLTSKSLDKVKLSVMRRERPSLTDQGLEFRDCVYLADELIKSSAFAKARRLKAPVLEAAFDTRLVDQIYLVKIGNIKLDRPIVCKLSERLANQQDYKGKCFAEVAEMQRHDAINRANKKPQQGASRVETMDADLKENAANRKSAIPVSAKGSKAQQHRDMAQLRKAEIFAGAPGQAFTPFLEAEADADGPPPSPAPSPQPAKPVFVPKNDDDVFEAYMKGFKAPKP